VDEVKNLHANIFGISSLQEIYLIFAFIMGINTEKTVQIKTPGL